MERHEQLSFHKQQKRQTNECLGLCLDQNGNLIREGDYVKAVRGISKVNRIEGWVAAVIPYDEEAGNYLKIVTAGGKVLEHHANPLHFEVVQE